MGRGVWRVRYILFWCWELEGVMYVVIVEGERECFEVGLVTCFGPVSGLDGVQGGEDDNCGKDCHGW